MCKSVEVMTGDIVEEAIGFVIEKWWKKWEKWWKNARKMMKKLSFGMIKGLGVDKNARKIDSFALYRVYRDEKLVG